MMRMRKKTPSYTQRINGVRLRNRVYVSDILYGNYGSLKRDLFLSLQEGRANRCLSVDFLIG